MFRRIKCARIEKGMTQEKLSELSGVSRATIIGLESGKTTNVKMDTLRKIANALGFTMDALFFDDGVSSNEQS